MRHKSKELTGQQRRFVEEYPIDLNSTQAALRAGYSPTNAARAGCFLLKRPEIREAIQEGLDRRAQRVHITQDMVLREYARLAFFDPRKLFNEDGSYTERSRKIIDGTPMDRFGKPEELVGKTLVACTNLAPRKMMGLESCGMLLSAEKDDKLNLLMLDDAIPAGAKLC